MKKYSAYLPLVFLTIALVVVLVVRSKLNAKLAELRNGNQGAMTVTSNGNTVTVKDSKAPDNE
ncbi:MAG: hypothetical protein H6617_02685 [Bdellovibrionaceae bacterium]|nr:hypothetical protein [Bdellovibrionales bacterium]MCB9253569.1 hypothetical protein [Pseudobdellovibrionaceae bacterium]